MAIESSQGDRPFHPLGAGFWTPFRWHAFFSALKRFGVKTFF